MESTRPSHPPQLRTPEMIGHARAEGNGKGRGERGGDASLPGDLVDSRVSCRIRPLAHLILNFFVLRSRQFLLCYTPWLPCPRDNFPPPVFYLFDPPPLHTSAPPSHSPPPPCPLLLLHCFLTA
eukprot:scaffold17390_cov104-Isochrysis_galbana.AAC.7